MHLLEMLLARFPGLARLPHGSYAVGGAVRDLLSGIEPADVDVTAHDPLACAELVARPHHRRPIRLGREQLTAWRVVVGDDDREIYDFAAMLDDSIESDLARRDYTVNAMAVDLTSGALLDLHGGADDLRDGVARMIRASNFDDDPLRMLKGVRVGLTRGLALEAQTLAAIQSRAPLIVDVAAERVSSELEQIFAAAWLRRALSLLRTTMLDVPLFGRTLDAHAFNLPDSQPDGTNATIALTLLFLGASAAQTRGHAQRWRWSEQRLREVLALQRLHARLLANEEPSIALFDAGAPVAAFAPTLLRATHAGEQAERIEALLGSRGETLFATEALLSGDELQALLTIAPGAELGRIKRALLEAQLREEVRSKAEAIAFVTHMHAQLR
jgi:tRNA nucleotidyltransferase/poly(A) polymerase